MKEFLDLVWAMPAGEFVAIFGGLLFALLLWVSVLAVYLRRWLDL